MIDVEKLVVDQLIYVSKVKKCPLMQQQSYKTGPRRHWQLQVVRNDLKGSDFTAYANKIKPCILERYKQGSLKIDIITSAKWI